MEPTPPPASDWDAALNAELGRRIAELATYPDDAFGRIGRGEAVALLLGFVMLPLLLVWWCR
jgi:hypothetical protein